MVNGRRLCYVSRNYKGRQGAGNKAKGDYEDILAQMGAHNLGLRRTYCKEYIAAFLTDLAGIVTYALFRLCAGWHGGVRQIRWRSSMILELSAERRSP